MKSKSLIYNLRPGRVEDAESIWNVRMRAIRGISEIHYSIKDMIRWSPEIMPEDFPGIIEKYEWFVVEVENKVVTTGFLDAEKNSVESIFTDPNYQYHGFASKILSNIESRAIELGIKKLTLDSTLAAENFYERNGFKALERSIYISPDGLKLECIKMEKLLS